MFKPTEAEVEEYTDKAMPIIAELCGEQHKFGSGRKISISRGLNLVMGCLPQSKKERAFTEAARRALWERFPNDLYPALAEKPAPKAQPHLRIVR